MATAGVDFFRVDRSGSTKRLLTVAGVLVALGFSAVGAHLVSRLEPALRRLVSLCGSAMMLAGLVVGFGAMAMYLFENVYLLIRDEGVLCHENGKETAIAWDDLEASRLGPEEGVIVLERRGSEPVRWFAGANAKELHARLEEAHRRALLGVPLTRPLR